MNRDRRAMSINQLSALASPLNDQQIDQLKLAAAESSPQQLAWISGYFWGLSQSQSPAAVSAPASNVLTAAKPAGTLTIIYASQTGNAKGVAEALQQQAQAQDIAVSLVSAGDFKAKNLSKETHVIIVASTHGEGEAPDDAIELHAFLQSKKAPKLTNLHYAVIGLGDSSYEFFCQTAKDFDHCLAKLGAQPMLERLDCDVDYDVAVAEWQLQVLAKTQQTLSIGEAEVVQLPVGQHQAAVTVYNKQHPFSATLSVSQKITGRGSDKDVRHIEIDLEDSGLTYQPGDALGVWFENDPQLVDAILVKLNLDAETSVEVDGVALSLRDALINKYELTASNPQFVTQYAELSNSKKLRKLVLDKAKLRKYAVNTQIIDVLAENKTPLTASQLLGLLRRLTPRLYSIASSQQEVGEEVHLTVGVVEFSQGDEQRQGGASSFLAQRLEDGAAVKVFVESNHNFKLPADDNTSVIMIGPGTGIAPFRAFVQERDNREAIGKNWLFFGDRTFTEDFLYQVEWQKYLKAGVVTQMDVAFSRDQTEKVYVQQRILEQASQVWLWMQDGAYVYVCGDATHMAKDVHQALLTVIEQQGNKTPQQAEQYLNELRKNKRYQRDVY